MVDVPSYTASLRFILQPTGYGLNIWGSIANTAGWPLVDQAIAGVTTLTVSAPVTLTSTNGATDQARSAILALSGTGGVITIPSVSKTYVVYNGGSGPMIFGTGSGRTATVAPSTATGTPTVILCDGTNVDRAANQTDIDAALTAAKTYTDQASFASASGNLPGQPGNAGKFLTTNGTSPSWAAAYTTGTTAGTVTAGNDSRFTDNANAAAAAQSTATTANTTANAALPASRITYGTAAPGTLPVGVFYYQYTP